MMDPQDNVFKQISPALAEELTKPRYDKEGLTIFRQGEHVVLRDYIFVVNKIDNLSKPNRLVLIPVGPLKSDTQVDALNKLAELSGQFKD